LISQHSTMGLPVDVTTVETQCSEGLKMIDGKCVPIESKLEKNELTPSEATLAPEPITTAPDRKVGSCPEGMEHGEHGICREIQPSQPTTVIMETTTILKEVLSGQENLNKCPESTQRNEQGSCQEIQPSNKAEITTDPKVLLKSDGSCPDGYKMVEGTCLFMKPKTKPILYPSGPTVDYIAPESMKPRVGQDSSILVRKVPVLPDNSCPIGTEYIENGLCEERILPTKSNLKMSSDGHCPEDFELINDKCTYKSSKLRHESQDLTTVSPLLPQTETTLVPEESNDKLPETTIEPKLDVEATTV